MLSGFCCVLVVGLLTACGRKAGPVENAARILGPTITHLAPDLGCAFAMGLRYQEPEFAVWVGGSGSGELGGKFSGGDEIVNPAPPQPICKFEGSLLGVALECRTTGGKSGTIKIGTETFQLERGALFLVSTSGAKPQVRQMALTKLNLQPEGPLLSGDGVGDYLRELAKTDPEIQRFWHSVSTVN